MTMAATAKDAVREILEQLPEDASYEEIRHRIYVREKVEKSRQAVREGRVLSQEEVGSRMAKWLDE
jgi:hypothetical protein